MIFEMKRSMTDKIEQYIKVLIERSENQEIIIQRAELAETFGCVPSQVTYVINTRFTQEDGYISESRRGGKGYVKITKHIHQDDPLVVSCREDLFNYLKKLHSSGQITKKEERLLKYLIVNSFKDLKPREQGYLYKTVKSVLLDFFQ